MMILWNVNKFPCQERSIFERAKLRPWWKVKGCNLSWINSTINYQKQNTTKFSIVDGDGKGWCEMLLFVFSLFWFLQVRENSDFIFQQRLVCRVFFNLDSVIVWGGDLECWPKILNAHEATLVVLIPNLNGILRFRIISDMRSCTQTVNK
jgi:hypothetical protein